ncbi:MAG: hypothetical protein H7296_13920 [Bacteroidia bacterium]|nr:hypothetical protein [Bacteroidia bacterium]
MKFILIFLIFLIPSLQLKAQEQTQEEIIDEGTKLYRNELTSWNATDYFSENYAEKSDEIGGSFSYADSNMMKCVFFSKSTKPTVIATVSFDTTIDIKSAVIDKKERIFTKYENELYTLQLNSIIAVASDNIFFKRYNNTSLVMVPLIDAFSKRVYIMTGVKQSCLVIFGNDYLIAFDENNKITYKKHLHKNIIPLECAKDITVDNNNVPGTMHIHNVDAGNLPTPTDICSLMLYSKQANWKKHTVFAPDSVCIWNCETSHLTVMSKEEWRTKFAVHKK